MYPCFPGGIFWVPWLQTCRIRSQNLLVFLVSRIRKRQSMQWLQPHVFKRNVVKIGSSFHVRVYKLKKYVKTPPIGICLLNKNTRPPAMQNHHLPGTYHTHRSDPRHSQLGSFVEGVNDLPQGVSWLVNLTPPPDS